jgi:hypothetical protein
MTQKVRTSTGLPVHLFGGPQRSRHDDHGVIRSDNLSRVYFPALAGVSFMSPIGTAYTPCLRAAKGDQGYQDDVFN